MAGAAEFPELIRDAFITETDNNAGIYGVTFFIRGKPWVVDVDDFLLFSIYDEDTEEVDEEDPQLFYARP